MQLKETIQEAAQFKVELYKSISLVMNEIIQYVFKSFIQVILFMQEIKQTCIF